MHHNTENLEWYVESKNVSPNRVTENFLDFMDMNIEDCKWRKITSIGWWFWIFEVDIAKIWADVTLVDPVYKDKSQISLKLDENKKRLTRKKRDKVQAVMNERKKELEIALANKQWNVKENEETLNFINECIENFDEYQCRRERLVNNLNEWCENVEKYNIKLNPSSWENIVWVEPSNQDIVMINHTLNHIITSTESREKIVKSILLEWYRLLNEKWILWIIDYSWDLKSFENMLLESEDKMKDSKFIKWSFSTSFSKDWLNKFIQHYFK